MKFAIGVFVGFFLFGEVGAFELGFSGGAGRLAGSNINESRTGPVANLSASCTLISGVDYIFSLQYARVSVEYDSTYVYRSFETAIRWSPDWKFFIPYVTGNIGLYDWKIEHDGNTATNLFTWEEMKARSLGLGGGIGFLWKLSHRVSADVVLASHLIFSQNAQKFGPLDKNEFLLQTRIGLWYKLF